MGSTELREVHLTDDANAAEILRLALEEEGIPCEVTGERQGGFTGLSIMKIKLFVRSEDFERARAFIEEHEHRRRTEETQDEE